MRARIASLSIIIISVFVYLSMAFWPAGVAADSGSRSTTTQSTIVAPVKTAPTTAPPTTTTTTVAPTTTTQPYVAPTPTTRPIVLSAPDLVTAWTRVAVCEQGGWGNYGFPAYPNSLGINAQSWAQFGGGADLSVDAQIAVAERFRAYYGISIPDQNGCAAW